MSDATPDARERGAPPHREVAKDSPVARHRNDAAGIEPPLAGGSPLVDVHAHFLHAGCGRANWRDVNAARMRAGARIGITCHVGSILGSFGHSSPTYFASTADVVRGNDEMLAIEAVEEGRVRSYVHVNPNEGERALREVERCVERGAIGVKLSASRRADDAVVDPIADEAGRRGLPVLHHIWQWRRHEWGGQEASDGVELARLAARHPQTNFILAHIGGGGDYAHSYPAVRELPNVYLDTSGSGVDRGMLDDALAAVGAARIVWGCDLTICTGLAKLRALEVIGLSADELAMIRWRNAARIFPRASFDVSAPAPSAAAHAPLAPAETSR
ncbi:MAG TPA: amidohydrolase family protein [Gemmatimonadaceae bacterium]|nr:amidohydrolase family protein [Gemmatimonadaceae bacterium]